MRRSTANHWSGPPWWPLPDGAWRLYVSCATPGTKHWRVDALDADDPTGFDPASARTVLPGDDGRGRQGPGGQTDPRAVAHVALLPPARPELEPPTGCPPTTARATDGLEWTDPRRGAGRDPGPLGPAGGPGGRGRPRRWALAGLLRRPGLQGGERRGADRVGRGQLARPAGAPGASRSGPRPEDGVRSGTCRPWPCPTGGIRLYYETSRLDGAHDLRTEYVPPSR